MTIGYIEKFVAGSPIGLRLSVSETQGIQDFWVGSRHFIVKHGKNSGDDITVKIDKQKLVHISPGARLSFDAGGMFNVDVIHS